MTRRDVRVSEKGFQLINQIERGELLRTSAWNKLKQHVILMGLAPLFRRRRDSSEATEVMNRWRTLEEKMIG